MLPANQGFRSDNAVTLAPHLRLIDQEQFSRSNGPAQLIRCRDARADVVVHRLGIEAIGMPSFGLRAVQGHVRVGQQGFGVERIPLLCLAT